MLTFITNLMWCNGIYQTTTEYSRTHVADPLKRPFIKFISFHCGVIFSQLVLNFHQKLYSFCHIDRDFLFRNRSFL